MKKQKPLWSCPKCRRKFVNKNQWHSCGDYTVEGFLENKTEYAVSIYNGFVEALRAIGDFECSPAKTRIAFQKRIRFAAVNRIGRDFISGHLILKRKHDSKIFHRVELDTIHHFKISKPEDINEEFIEFLKEAYSVGMREHLKN